MRIYHGTNVDFDTIELSKLLPYKDFGRGFYLTEIYDQARKMAERKMLSNGGKIIIQTYEFDEMILNSNKLNVLKFESPIPEWAEFIFKNRSIVLAIDNDSITPPRRLRRGGRGERSDHTVNNHSQNNKSQNYHHAYDIIIRPVADDGVVFLMNQYRDGAITLRQMARMLRYKNLTNQYCFCTDRALTFLRRIQ